MASGGGGLQPVSLLKYACISNGDCFSQASFKSCIVSSFSGLTYLREIKWRISGPKPKALISGANDMSCEMMDDI